MDRLKSCIIGLGQVGLQFDFDKKRSFNHEVWTHFSAYETLSEKFELTAAVDPIESTHKQLLSKNPNIQCFFSIQELLSAKLEIDLVSICTPDHLHFECFYRLLPNVKGILMEKPITDNSEQLKSFVNILPNYYGEKSLKINFYKRYEPSVLFVKEDISDDEIKYIECIYTGPFKAVGSHALDLILQFVQISKVLSTIKHTRPSEGDGFTANFIGRNKEIISLVNANCREKFIFELNIITDRARYHLTDNLENVFISKIAKSDKYTNYFEFIKNSEEVFENKNKFKHLLEESYDEITKKRFDYSNIQNAIDTQKLLEEIERF